MRNHIRTILFVLVVGVFAAACGSATGPDLSGLECIGAELLSGGNVTCEGYSTYSAALPARSDTILISTER